MNEQLEESFWILVICDLNYRILKYVNWNQGLENCLKLTIENSTIFSSECLNIWINCIYLNLESSISCNKVTISTEVCFQRGFVFHICICGLMESDKESKTMSSYTPKGCELHCEEVASNPNPIHLFRSFLTFYHLHLHNNITITPMCYCLGDRNYMALQPNKQYQI